MTTNTHDKSTESPASDNNATAHESGHAAGRPTPPQAHGSGSDAVDQVIEAAAMAGVVEQEPTQIEQLQSQLAAAEDRVLRAHAELENYRKRASRLLEEERKYAPLALLRDLLPVVDNLERAIQSADQNGGSAGLLEGVKMVAQQLHSVLERHHCRRIEAKGAAFDPHLHEAIAQVPREDLPPGTVVDVASTGYQLHDRVVRPTQVLVSTRPAAPPAPPEAEDDANET